MPSRYGDSFTQVSVCKGDDRSWKRIFSQIGQDLLEKIFTSQLDLFNTPVFGAIILQDFTFFALATI